MSTEKEIMSDEEATPLDWFLLDCFRQLLFDDKYELQNNHSPVNKNPDKNGEEPIPGHHP